MDTETLSDMQKVDEILEKMDAEEGDASEDQQDSQGKPAKVAPEAVSDETETEADETTEPETAIEAPSTWKAELKARWNELPPDLQRDLAQWETERNKGFGTKLNEAAELRKQAEAEKQAAQQERAKFAQLADYLTQQTQGIDPLLAEAASLDWNKLALENPAEWAAKRQAVETRIRELQTVEGERQRVALEARQKAVNESHQKLVEAIPEWKDDAKRDELRKQLAEAGKSYGYTPEELSSVVNHRDILVLKDAMAYRQLMAAQQTAQAKKVPTVQTARTIKPTAQREGNQINDRTKALRAKAIRSGKEGDAVAAVLAAIGE